jgi:uncharacterized membrane protein
MEKTRLEAFSDGVFAIIITIMVLEMKVPHGSDWASLKTLLPTFTSYILSFLFAGIYWGNHHHLLHTVKKINSRIMLANLNLLFWLSLIPIATGWMGENNFSSNPVAVYAILLLLCGSSFTILQKTIEKNIPHDHPYKIALKKTQWKGIISLVGYACALPLAYVNPLISCLLFLAVSIMWIVPDKNIERALKD